MNSKVIKTQCHGQNLSHLLFLIGYLLFKILKDELYQKHINHFEIYLVLLFFSRRKVKSV